MKITRCGKWWKAVSDAPIFKTRRQGRAPVSGLMIGDEVLFIMRVSSPTVAYVLRYEG